MDLFLFDVVKKRLNWLTQRQEVLAQNVANADTPDYTSKDLRPFEFHELIRREAGQLNMDAQGPDELGGRRKRIKDFQLEEPRHPFETHADGNSITLEEEMGKISETQISHKATIELYKKHIQMMKIAISKGN